MKEIEIDLSEPFEKVLEAVLALPKGSVNGAADDGAGQEELKEVVRGLYEAANGRHVETGIGLIAIAPPIAPFLKTMPLRAATLRDFLVSAAAQIVSLPLCRNGRSPAPRIANRRERKKQSRRVIEKRNDSKISEFLTPQITAAHHD